MAENQEPAGQPPLPPTPRRSANAAERGTDTSSQLQSLASLADSVKLLASQLGGSEPVNPPSAADERGRRVRKFQRSGSGETFGPTEPSAPEPPLGDPIDDPEDDASPSALAAEDIPSESPAIDDPTRNKNIAWPRLGRDGMPPAAPRRRRRSMTIPMLVLLGCNLVMLALGFLMGIASSTGNNPPKAAAASSQAALPPEITGPRSVSDELLGVADTALKAEKSGDVATARRIYDNAVTQHDSLPGAEYRLAILGIRRSDLLDADLHLARSTDEGEYVASCDYVRSTFAGARGNYADACRQMEGAVHAAPFDAKYFFCWGECLRRVGKPLAAIDAIGQALDRPYSAEEGDLYLFKLGLAKIETGRDTDFDAQLDRRLKEEPVSGDSLLLAAARDLEHDAYQDAADHLQKATLAMTTDQFNSRVRDYLFASHITDKEVAPYLNRVTPPVHTEAGPSVMDPGSWAAEKADPGTWPTSRATRR